MNKVIITGRPTADPDIRRTQEGLAIARWTMAVDRYREGADFISCNAFGQQAEFVEKYVRKGQKYLVEGRVQTGSYEKEGRKIYTTDVVTERLEFLEKKGSQPQAEEPKEEFMNIPDGLDEELPFH